MTDLLTLAFLLALIALTVILLPRWREAPALSLWACLQTLRSAIWFMHDWNLITHIALLFPIIQFQAVLEAVMRSRPNVKDKRRWPYYLWCILLGLALALFALALNPPPYPSLSRAAYAWHLGAHLAMLGMLVASIAYTGVILPSDTLSLRTRQALMMYFAASVGADRIHDRVLWDAATNLATIVQTVAVLYLVGVFGLSRREHPAST